ncbi:MAG: hypothetical protein ABSH09_20560 [Bryobacteraceae bacterium]|jgi:hypothetical protein
MRVVRAFFIATGAILGAGLLSVIAWLFFGAFLPLAIMMAVHGFQAVYDSPAHGGAVLMATVPLAGIFSVIAFLYLSVFFYHRISKRVSR